MFSVSTKKGCPKSIYLRMEHLKLMSRLFGRKQNTDYSSSNEPSKKPTEDSNDADRLDWQKRELYKKGIDQIQRIVVFCVSHFIIIIQL
ncbi:MAG: hypothetical protein ACJ712_04705 [Nitrososphaeraceae archaeon]